MAKYKWDYPKEWLEEKIQKGEFSSDEVLNDILSFVDNDTIQDIYQDEMDEDGYFIDLDSIPWSKVKSYLDTCKADEREDIYREYQEHSGIDLDNGVMFEPSEEDEDFIDFMMEFYGSSIELLHDTKEE